MGQAKFSFQQKEDFPRFQISYYSILIQKQFYGKHL
jgi:hypothetical protein